jgi:Flp pilus assembly protein TadG
MVSILPRNTHRYTTREPLSGQALVIFALMGFVLVGFVALAIDGGFIMAERRQVQSAADAGALAAARALYDRRDSLIVPSGQNYATMNAGAGSSTTVHWPPADGNYVNNRNYVQVKVTQPVTPFFVGAFYNGDWEVSTTATAGVERVPANYALIVLNRNTTPGIHMNGNTGIRITNGGSAMSNTNITSNGVTSFTTQGTNTFIDANQTITPSGGTWNPPEQLRPGTPQTDDPLAGMPVPPKGQRRNFNSAGCPGNSCRPGHYKDETISLNGTWNLQPGIYYFENTHITLLGQSALVGTNVLLYFDANSTLDVRTGDLRLTGSTTPLYTGMQPRLTLWYARCGVLDAFGNSVIQIVGIFYAPCAFLQMHGTPGINSFDGQVVVGRLEVKGTSDLNIRYYSWVTTRRPKVFLVE